MHPHPRLPLRPNPILREKTNRARLHNLAQRQVHPRVAQNEVSVERLAVLELDHHRVALGGREEPEWQLY
jgi:hypothetical protein